MIPIYEQGSGRGIGHTSESFLERFQQIAFDHMDSGRAKAVAFVFYDFNDYEFKEILKDQGVFAQLDRLSGQNLSVFYLHSGSDALLKKFNAKLKTALGVYARAKTPCVVFCRATDKGFEDIAIANLESPDLINGFHELYGVIESYIGNINLEREPKSFRWIKGASKFVSLEVIKAAIAELIKIGLFGR